MCVFLCSFISLVLHLALHNIINFWHLDDVALLKKWGFLILVLFFSDLFLFNLHISSYSSKVVLSFFWYACSCDCVLFMCVCVFFFPMWVACSYFIFLSFFLYISLYGFLSVVVVIAICFALLEIVFALFCSSFVFVFSCVTSAPAKNWGFVLCHYSFEMLVDLPCLSSLFC